MPSRRPVAADAAFERLLLVRYLTAADRGALAGLLARTRFEPGPTLQYLGRHGLRPFAGWTLAELSAEGLFPRRFAEVLAHAHRQQRERDAVLLRRTGEVLDHLGDAGLDAMALKGPLLGTRFYGGLGRRGVDDVDVLLKDPEALPAADALLRGLGMQRRSLTPLGWRAATRFSHHFEYEADGVPLDLHWVLRRHFSFRLDDEGLWRRAGRVAAGSAELQTLADSDLLWFLLLSAFLDVQHGKVRMKSFVDLFRVLDRLDPELEWPVFFAAREREGLLEICRSMLDLVLLLLDGRGRLQRLASFLDEKGHDPGAPEDAIAAWALVSGSELSLRNRGWGFRRYDAPLWKSVGWWMLSLPVKNAVYRRVPRAWRRGGR